MLYIFTRFNKKSQLHPAFLYLSKLFLLNVPLFILFTLLRSNPSVQQWVSTSFPVYHLSKAIMIGAKIFLATVGYQTMIVFSNDTYHYGVFSINIIGGFPVFIGFSCLGLTMMWFYSTVIIASQGKVIVKALYILSGILVIQILNVLRMSCLTWLLRDGTKRNFPEFSLLDSITFDHHDLFNCLIYIIVFLLIVFWFENRKIKTLKSTSNHQEKTETQSYR